PDPRVPVGLLARRLGGAPRPGLSAPGEPRRPGGEAPPGLRGLLRHRLPRGTLGARRAAQPSRVWAGGPLGDGGRALALPDLGPDHPGVGPGRASGPAGPGPAGERRAGGGSPPWAPRLVGG